MMHSMHSGRRASLGFGLGAPTARRGFLPLLIAALSAGKAIYGAVSANQQKQRNKGYIDDAYRTASSRMDEQQRTGRQSNAEAMNARGLIGGGVSPIHAAMLNGASDATDLAGQSRAELEREYGLDRHSLDAQHTQALNENKADAMNAQIGAVSSGIQGAASAYGSAQEMGAMSAMNKGAGAASATKTPVASALLSGSAFDGVHPVDPLGDSSSSWYMGQQGQQQRMRGSLNGAGLANSDFNTSGVG